MRLHYISFFYYNIILFCCLIFKIDLIFFLILFIRKNHSMFKEALTEYISQEFDGLKKDNQTFDLHENKLYVDFGLDIGLEEAYMQHIYMEYAFYDISIDLENYSGNMTFKWNDSNIEELNYINEKNSNFRKFYSNKNITNLYFWKNIRNEININEIEEDSSHLYRYRAMHRREFEDGEFVDENEKFFFNYLKKFFLNSQYHNVFVDDNYISYLHYLNFINELKKKILNNKYGKNFSKKEELSIGIDMLSINTNILNIKKELLSNSFFEKLE